MSSVAQELWPDWDQVACGCCAGLEWGGETPRECRTCKGFAMLWLSPSGTRLALYPGGPFAGVATDRERKEAGRA